MKAWKTAHNHCTRSGTESDTTGWETVRSHSQSLSHTVYNQKQSVWVENCTATVPSFSHNQQIKPSTKTLFKSKDTENRGGTGGGGVVGVCVGGGGGGTYRLTSDLPAALKMSHATKACYEPRLPPCKTRTLSLKLNSLWAKFNGDYLPSQESLDYSLQSPNVLSHKTVWDTHFFFFFFFLNLIFFMLGWP